MKPLGLALNEFAWCPYKKEKNWEENTTPNMYVHREKIIWGYSMKVAIYKPRIKVSQETTLIDTLTWYILPP